MPEAARPVVIHRLPCSADFLDRCAHHIVAACRPQLPDLSGFLIVLPSPTLASDLRKALAAAAGCALLLPRLATLTQLAAPANAGSQPDSLRQLTLYRLLRERGWFADGALWEICAELIALFEELNERAIGLPEDETVLIARLEQAYDAYGSEPLRFEAEVVHRLWRAEASGPPGCHAATALALAQLAEQGAAPLFMVCEGEPRPVEMAFCRAWAGRQAATVFLPRRDVAAAPLMQGLNAAWPAGEDDALPLTRRADAARASLPASPLAGRLHLIGAASLEEEAVVVAAEVRRWLSMGRKKIALVACDRVAARRARALLERDGILVQDETGWKLATTRAAALLDAWLEVVSADAYHRDLLDLVKSPFVFDELPEEARQAGLMQLEDGLARHNLAYGLARYESVLAREAGHVEAVGMLRQVAAARRRMPRASASVDDWLTGLEQALGELGALPGLARDEAGATLLALLRTRREELSAVSGRLTFGEWREWLNRELESATFIDRGIESPLVMTHLAATRLRRFDAAILIGADRDNLAPAHARAIFSNPAVRSDLGLSLPAEAVARLRDDLAGLIAFSGEVTATWQMVHGDEANLLCSELSLLSVLHTRAWGDDLIEPPPAARTFPLGAGTAMPRPAAPQRVPLRLSPSAYASLMACPYQFYARRMLGLAEAEEVREALEKKDYGEYVHRILQRFHAMHAQLSGRPDEVLEAALVEISREVFAPVIEDNFLDHAWQARWLECVPGYIAWQKVREAAGWRYAGGELVRERTLPLTGDGDLLLQGRLDRLDRRADGSEAVLDYKTQDAQVLRRRLADPDEDVQLACYALLQGEQVDEAAYVALNGEKPVQLGLPEVQALARKQEMRLIAVVEALRAGAELPAHGIDAACAWCEARGLCRRDYHAEEAKP
ncbi:MAG: PD-(D/E)XK nuclease family protein [Sulfuritalea sp.]|nr:PD-(D/E)XK nuclease family protein [Sulfuritalea sp.]